MKIFKFAAAAVIVLGLATSAAAVAGMGVTINDQGLNSFYLSIGNYHRIPEREVIVVRQRGIPDEELPVVFFIAARAGVHYDEIIKLRLKKWGWMKIVYKYKLDPAIFYVPVKAKVAGRAYGRAYGYYMTKPQVKWKHIKLNDVDVVNFVNLRFVSEYYGYDPDEVIKMRESGRGFVEIDREVKVWKNKQGKTVKVKTVKVKTKHKR